MIARFAADVLEVHLVIGADDEGSAELPGVTLNARLPRSRTESTKRVEGHARR